MFNLDTYLGVRFGNVGAQAVITVVFPETPNPTNFAVIGNTIGEFFQLVEEGTTTPTRLLLGDNNATTNEGLEHSFNQLLFIPTQTLTTGAEWATSIAGFINAVSKTDGTQAQSVPGTTGFTPAIIRSLCTATVGGLTGEAARTLILTTDNPTVSSIFIETTTFDVDATILNGISSSIGDHHIEMASFSDNRVYTSTTDRLIELEYYKPFNAIFVYLPVPSTTENPLINMSFVDPNGRIITQDNFTDGTQGLTQSGFIYWKREKDITGAFNSGLSVLKLDYGLDIQVTFGGINLLFCDKFDLLREYPDLDSLLGISDERIISPQLIRIMESTMLEIEKKVQNSPFWKEDRQYFFTAKELDRWDLLQINEINQAAIFWTLAKILYFLSDNPGDIYSLKAADYRARGETAFASVNLSLDFNDNGSLDVFEGEREAANIEITFER